MNWESKDNNNKWASWWKCQWHKITFYKAPIHKESIKFLNSTAAMVFFTSNFVFCDNNCVFIRSLFCTAIEFIRISVRYFHVWTLVWVLNGLKMKRFKQEWFLQEMVCPRNALNKKTLCSKNGSIQAMVRFMKWFELPTWNIKCLKNI